MNLTNIEYDIVQEALLELAKSRYLMPNTMIDYRKKTELIFSVYDKVEELRALDKKP